MAYWPCSFTISQNESFKEEGCEFNHVRHTYGRRTFVCISDIFGGKFSFQNGDLLLELMLRKAKTVFEYTMIFPLSQGEGQRKRERGTVIQVTLWKWKIIFHLPKSVKE